MRYKANPVEVVAHRIVQATAGDEGLIIELENGQVVRADAGMIARMFPTTGDYWVIQDDGYIYLNPKDVFERKYTSIEHQTVSDQHPGRDEEHKAS